CRRICLSLFSFFLPDGLIESLLLSHLERPLRLFHICNALASTALRKVLDSFTFHFGKKPIEHFLGSTHRCSYPVRGEHRVSKVCGMKLVADGHYALTCELVSCSYFGHIFSFH